MARRLSLDAMVIFWGGVNELDINIKMKRLQKFLMILSWPVSTWVVADTCHSYSYQKGGATQ